MQTLDQKAADMIVDITLEPELRGELDPLKLARILKLIPVLSTTFSIGDCLTTVSASDFAVYGTDQPYVMPMLPMGDDSESLSLADIVKRTIAATDTSVNKSIIVIDPVIVSMSVNIKIPEVALDLTYDPLRARHLVLAVRALEMQVLLRSRDMQVRSFCNPFIALYNYLRRIMYCYCSIMIFLFVLQYNQIFMSYTYQHQSSMYMTLIFISSL